MTVDARPSTSPWCQAVGIVVATAVIRAVIAAALPLFPDETYYWEWSRRLAPGYFDHPPAIALMIRAGTAALGHTPFGVRLVPLLAGMITALFVLLLARQLGDDRAARRGAIVLACLPIAAGGLGLATPDAPLLSMVAVSVYAVVRAVSYPARSARSLVWWLIAGASLGGAMVSKYTAVLLPTGVLAAVITNRQLRTHLTSPGPYVAVLVALSVISPVVGWNRAHDWISFRFQLAHGLGARRGSILAQGITFFGTQIGLASPLLFGLLVVATSRSLGSARSPAHWLVAVVAAVSIGFFGVSALRRPVQSNWPSLFYIPATALLAVAAVGPAWRRWFQAACGLGALAVLVLYVHASSGGLPIRPSRDPIARAHGWDQLAARLSLVMDSLSRGPSRAIWIASDRYEDASELAFHLPGHPTVLSVNLVRRRNQHDLWPGFRDLARSGDCLLLAIGTGPEPHPLVELLRPHFETTRVIESFAAHRRGGVIRARRLWMLDGWRGSWPVGAAAPPRSPEVIRLGSREVRVQAHE